MKIVISENCPQLSATWIPQVAGGGRVCIYFHEGQRGEWWAVSYCRSAGVHQFRILTESDYDKDASVAAGTPVEKENVPFRVVEFTAESPVERLTLSMTFWHVTEKEADHFLFYDWRDVPSGVVRGYSSKSHHVAVVDCQAK